MQDDLIRHIFVKSNTIAVYGMSRKAGKDSHAVANRLGAWRYTILPINPHAGGIEGGAYSSQLSEIQEKIDILLIFRPSHEVPHIVREAVKRREEKGDITVVWLQEGIRSDESRELAKNAGIVFVQDRCTLKEYRRVIPPEGQW